MTIYLDADTQRAVETAAAREALSVSRWARRHLQAAAYRSLKANSLDSFYGAITDESFEVPPPLKTADSPRAPFEPPLE